MIREGVFDDPQVRDLLALHMAGMLANSPPDKCHFLDLSGLRRDNVAFYTSWDGDALVAMGALMTRGDAGEVKSMRVVPARAGEGHGAAMLRHIVAKARAKGLRRLDLETGTGPAFVAATALYRRHGFTACGPFADYVATDFNRFMTLAL